MLERHWTEREIFDGLSGGVRIHARQAPSSLVVEQEQPVLDTLATRLQLTGRYLGISQQHDTLVRDVGQVLWPVDSGSRLPSAKQKLLSSSAAVLESLARNASRTGTLRFDIDDLPGPQCEYFEHFSALERPSH
jgi:hypothetical protein